MKAFAMIVLASLWPPLASADAKAGEQKAQLCLVCHKRDIADYFASRKPIAVSYPVDPAAVSRGQALAESM
jgi:cytochrome c553